MNNKTGKLLLATVLLPPVGLAGFWMSQEHAKHRVRATVWTLLYSVLYAAIIIWLLMRFAGLQVEWKGGFPPVLTFEKTVPDYEALERHRQATINVPAQVVLEGSTYWTGFRGPRRDGIYEEQTIRTNWPSDGLKPLWKQPIGGGYSSFAIANGVAYTIEQRRDQEAITAYELRSGRELWARSYPAKFEEWMGGEGPRATPTWDEGRVYALGAEGDLHCLKGNTGEILWKTNILRMAGGDLLPFACAASPLIFEDKLIVLAGGAGNSVVALNKLTGEKIWGAHDDRQAYVSPITVQFGGVTQLLVVSAHRAMGLKPENGELLWSFPWEVKYENSIAQPVLLSTNKFLLSGGYGAGAVAVEVIHERGKFRTKELWRNKRLKNKFASSVYYEGYIYGLDEDILTCLDAESGRQEWKDGRYGYGQVVIASGELLILGGEGKLTLVQTNPKEHAEITESPGLTGKTWNYPALSDGLLLIRNAVEAACFDLR